MLIKIFNLLRTKNQTLTFIHDGDHRRSQREQREFIGVFIRIDRHSSDALMCNLRDSVAAQDTAEDKGILNIDTKERVSIQRRKIGRVAMSR